MNLYDRLLEYGSSDYYPMHMPGHKRNAGLLHMTDPYSIDITEIEGFDNLHHAQGILLEGMERAAALYGSEHTSYLTGGSTAGILTGIAACTSKGDRILVARNSHKSVYNAIYLQELKPVYIYPEILPGYGIHGGITPQTVEEMLIKYPDIKQVVITSPTYEGIISDISGIAQAAHRHGVPLLVDEAHGAHLGFHKGFPAGSVSLGADIVIHSIHKTLPAFTQTALIHVNGSLVEYEEIKRYLAIYQSSSPSYILMAGMEQCITLLEQKKEELFEAFYKQLNTFYNRLEGLKCLKLLTPGVVRKFGGYDFDPSKITVSAKGTEVTGKYLYDQLLNRYHIQMEMTAGDYVLGMTSIADTKEGFDRLEKALLGLDKELMQSKRQFTSKGETKGVKGTSVYDKGGTGYGTDFTQKSPERVLDCHEAYKKPKEVILLTDSEERIAAEYIYLYPPGIPLLVPGEKVSCELLSRLAGYLDKGLSLQGLEDMDGKYIKVVADGSAKPI